MTRGGIPLDFAVVGCGPSRMAAAILPAGAGRRTRIFERFPAPKPIGTGLKTGLLGRIDPPQLEEHDTVASLAFSGANG